MSIFVEMKFQIDLKILFKTRKREKKIFVFKNNSLKKNLREKKCFIFKIFEEFKNSFFFNFEYLKELDFHFLNKILPII